jgi:hypothetical protein
LAATQDKTKHTDNDAGKAAAAAWRRFVACVEALPPDEAEPFWQDVDAQSAVAIYPNA